MARGTSASKPHRDRRLAFRRFDLIIASVDGPVAALPKTTKNHVRRRLP
jgi:hypothetical protein